MREGGKTERLEEKEGGREDGRHMYTVGMEDGKDNGEIYIYICKCRKKNLQKREENGGGRVNRNGDCVGRERGVNGGGGDVAKARKG